MVGGKGQKSMRRRECAQPGRPPALSRLRCVPVIIGASFSSRGIPPSFDIFVWQAYRARPAKKDRAVRVDAIMLYHRKSRRTVFSDEVRGSKNVPSHRGWVNFQKKKKIAFSSPRVKRGRKREQTNERRRRRRRRRRWRWSYFRHVKARLRVVAFCVRPTRSISRTEIRECAR